MTASRSLGLATLLPESWRALLEHSHTDIPVPRQSLALALKAAVDEVAVALSGATLPSRSHRERIQAEVLAARELFEYRGWADEPIRYHRTPPALESPRLRSRRWRNLPFTHLEFDSGFEPHFGEPGRARWLHYDANHTAHAWVLRHPGRPRPWLMCIHGFRMGAPGVDLAGFQAQWLYQRLGLNLILPVLPLHGPRKIGRRSGDGFLTGDVMNAVHAEAQAMWDMRRLLGWVRAQRAPAVGIYGLSLGGYTAALLAAIEDDLACVIAGIPATDFARLADRHMPKLIRRYANGGGFLSDAVEPVLRVISPLALPPRVHRDRRYLFAGLVDRLVPPEHVRDLWYHWEKPRLVWYEGGHLSFPWEPPVRQLLREALQESGLVRR